MIEDVSSQLTQGVHREPFSSTSGDPKPLWERVLLVYYAVVVSLAASWIILICGRSIIRRARCAFAPSPVGGDRSTGAGSYGKLVGRRNDSVGDSECNPYRWEPRVLLVLMVAIIPVLFAARALPKLGEVGDRANTFCFSRSASLLLAAQCTGSGFDGAYKGRDVDQNMDYGRKVWILGAVFSFVYLS